jgi:KipI family sensor histidine kinase inhibitor
VCYGGAGGVDLEEIAGEKGMGAAAFAKLHSEAEYRVAFLGFTPGFGYLTGLPALLASPRLATPRLSVPWGSVAIGGAYTGVYPSTTPGGWRLIGRTPISLFDPSENPPARLAAGDRVRFVPIEEWRFAAMTAGRTRP